jgi:hypothetical protein
VDDVDPTWIETTANGPIIYKMCVILTFKYVSKHYLNSLNMTYGTSKQNSTWLYWG